MIRLRDLAHLPPDTQITADLDRWQACDSKYAEAAFLIGGRVVLASPHRVAERFERAVRDLFLAVSHMDSDDDRRAAIGKMRDEGGQLWSEYEALYFAAGLTPKNK